VEPTYSFAFADWPIPGGTVGSVLLFVFVILGHTALQVFTINWLLGFPYSRLIMRPIRKLSTLVVVFGPFLLLWLFLQGWEYFTAPWWGWLILAYAGLCLIMGLIVAPVSQALYWYRRRRPQALLCNHSEVVDFAQKLGYKPFGSGKYLHLARLPRNEIFQVEFNEKHIVLPNLPPAWDGLSILHLTDLHLRGIPDKVFYQQVTAHCRKWQPDLLAITGDITDSILHHRWIIPVLGQLTWKHAAFAILGNHDQWYNPPLARRRLAKLGIDVLANTWKEIIIRGEPLLVVGHEGPWFTPPPDLADYDGRGFCLCLSHTPDNIAWARTNAIDLMLSGHNHGGQIRFPWIGSVFVPSKTGRRFDCGTFDLPPTFLHVSRGLAGQHPIRYNCRPEVTLLVLHRGGSKS
jgi:predicted MPP superfamily phosphohydrolase